MPQGGKKVPFSGKLKKQQLQAKRERKAGAVVEGAKVVGYMLMPNTYIISIILCMPNTILMLCLTFLYMPNMLGIAMPNTSIHA